MENFTAYNPTRVYFGKEVISGLSKSILPFGKNILLVYGMGSIKRTGLYEQIINQLKQSDISCIEFAGIKSNPVVEDVNKIVALAKDKNIDLILAVGGGSVIDSAKIAALAIPENLEAWQIMKGLIKPSKTLPLITVLTFSGTGSEMNPYAVLQNQATREKIGYGNALMFPKVSFLDPQYTFSVPPDQTAYGITDLIAHSLEAFFGEGDAPLTDRFIAAIIKDAMSSAHIVLKQPDDYATRANIMWAATCALNGMTIHGRKSADWGVHDIGHILSFLYDLPHGATLSIAYPAWLKLMSNKIPDRIKKLGKLLYDQKSVDKTIENLELFFRSINCPVRLSETGANMNKEEIIALMSKNSVNGLNYKLSEDDYRTLVDLMF